MNKENLTTKIERIYVQLSSLNMQPTPHNVELMYTIFYSLKTLMEEEKSKQDEVSKKAQSN